MVARTQFGEQVMTFAEAAGWLERRFGRRPNIASIWRWATKGIRGIRLATIALGRFRYTTESALERFIAETSQLDAGTDRFNSSIKGTAAAKAPPEFSKAEVVAATRRREREKAKALEFLRSRLGAATRRSAPSSTGGEVREKPPS
jgi:hypothetical protein